MHDIICPQCSESFIARDVVFDFSDYIPRLISDGTNDDIVRSLGVKYYIDEEEILNNPAHPKLNLKQFIRLSAGIEIFSL